MCDQGEMDMVTSDPGAAFLTNVNVQGAGVTVCEEADACLIYGRDWFTKKWSFVYISVQHFSFLFKLVDTGHASRHFMDILLAVE